MPKYYFNIADESGFIRDEEGMDLPNLAAAQSEAEESARELLANAIRSQKEVDGRQVSLTDKSGSVLQAVKLRDMLD
jgi:hypothetical protein